MKYIFQQIEKQSLALIFLLLSGFSLQAQNFPIGSLPAGKTIVVTYEVDVNANSCDPGNLPPANLSNQSNVSGTNFGTVQTDDPDIGGASNPTLTPFASFAIGNLIYNDINRDGDYDAGTDAGINGVVVKIYVDVNANNMLDAGDGAAIGMTTTATLSGQDGAYTFDVCSGGAYIIEVAASNFLMGGALYNSGNAYVSSPVGGAGDPDVDTDDNDDNGDPVSGFGVATAAFAMGAANNNTIDLGFKTPTTVSINDVTLNEGTGGSTTSFNFTVTRNDASEAFSLTVNTNNGTATTADNDYTAISGGTVSFTAGGSLTATVTVLVNHDNKVEANETLTVDLSGAPGGVVITDASGLGTITNDDNAVVTLSGGIAQNEGTSFVFTATLNNPVQGGFSVAYTTNNGTATIADNDYTDNDGTLSFTGTAGETKTITVNTTTDNKVELNETFTVALGAITGAPAGITTAGSPQTGTITNDDAATVAIAANVSQSEAITPQVFSVTLSNPIDVPVTVQFSTTNGTATTADNDYTGIASQTVTFPAGTTAVQSVNVAITNDAKVEADETYSVSIGTLSASGRNVSLGTSTRTGTITNDDNATVTLSGGGAANEGNSGTTSRVFTATLSNAVQGGFTANYTTNDGTATIANSDYQDNDASLTFAGTAGETKTFTVLVNGDHVVEANETFQTAINGLTGVVNPGAVTIVASPQTATISNDEIDFGDAFDIGSPFFTTLLANNGARHQTLLGVRLGATIDGENDGQPTIDASGDGADEDGVTWPSVLVKGTTANITVNASAAGFLNAWVDFEGNFTWSDAGNQIFNNFPLLVGNNNLSFSVPVAASSTTSFARFRFSSAGNDTYEGAAADGEVEDYVIDIVDNQFSVDDPTVLEGNAGSGNLVFTVSRTNNSTASSVDYAITGGTATSGSDYVPLAAGTVNFTAGGALTQTLTVTVNGDLIIEDNETVIMTLSNPVGGGISDNTGSGTITNDDVGTLTLSGGIAQNEGNAGAITYTFTATLSAAVQGGFTAPYTTNDATATTADNDYGDNDGNLNFAGTAGETKTFTVTANGDNKVELNETFTTALGTLTGSSAVQIAAITKAGSPQTSTITNDDAATVAIAGNISQSEAITPQVFSVTLSNPVDVPVSVQFSTTDGTATTADNDYTGIASQSVTFPSGTTIAQPVNVAITSDTKVEADETYSVSINALSASGRNVSLGTSTRTGTITNDDNATVTLSGGGAANEGNTGTTARIFTATLNNAVQGGFTANYTTNDGTATIANNDYQDNDASLIFAGTAGETKTFTVLVNGDNVVEADETIQTAINSLTGVVNPAAVTIVASPQTATITNDEIDFGDAPDTYATLLASNGARHATVLGFRLGAAIDGENDGQPSANASGDGADEDGVTLPNPLVTNTTANITVNASAAGKIDAWVDFNNNGNFGDAGENVLNNVAVVAGNNALSFAVPNGATPSNTFARFRLSSAGGLTFNGLAVDGEVEDYAVQIVNTQFSINDPSVTEGNAGTTNLGFVITRSNNASACSVNYAITGGTATVADNDYQALAAGTANFTAGGALTQTINVVVNGDVKVELNETVDMTLSSPVNGTIVDASGTGIISNDDAATITLSNQTVTEGDGGTINATFTITMSNPSDANVVLNYATIDGSATLVDNDYQNTSGSHTFTPGQVSKQVSVPVVGDCSIEVNETFQLRLSALVANGRNITLSGGGATLDGTGTITNDDALPVITCAGNLSQNVDPGVCTTSVTLTLPTTSSICGSATLEFRYRTVDASNNPTGLFTGYFPSGSNIVVFSRGRYEIEWRVTDGSGSSSCNLYLQVNDTQPPSIVCPANQTIPANATCSGTVGTWNAVSVSDNCTPSGSIVVTQSPAASTVLSGHNDSKLVTLTANDGNGNTQSCTFTVTLKDVTAPSIVCKPFTANLNAAGTASITPANVYQSGTDNCGTVNLQSVVLNTFNCSNIGANTVTLTANDGNGNTGTCTAVVTVVDAIAPTMLCKNATLNLNAAGQATLTVAQVNNGSFDNCTIVAFALSQTLFTCANLGNNTVTLSGRDQSSNQGQCNAVVTVVDPIAPVAKCKNATVDLGANGTVVVPASAVDNGSTDNCSFTLVVLPGTFNCSNIGMNTVTLKATDAGGNTATCTAKVLVRDITGPNALCKNPTIFLNSSGQATLTVADVNNGSSDNCAIATMSINKSDFNCSEISGTQLVILSMTDVNGNTASCQSYVTVKDAQAPTPLCENVTVQLNSNGKATVYGADLASESFDNCSVWSYSPIAKVYTAANLGNNNLTITVKDWSGNGATCVSVVTVIPGFQDPGSNRSNDENLQETGTLPFNVYPNPSTGDVSAAFELPVAQAVTLRVFDSQGRMVYSRTEIGAEGENAFLLRLEGLASGLYLVDFQSEGQKAQKRLLIQH